MYIHVQAMLLDSIYLINDVITNIYTAHIKTKYSIFKEMQNLKA